MIKSKGYQRALKIAMCVLKSNNNYQFSFAGEYGSKENENYFNNFVFDNKLSENVKYLGAINSRSRKAELFLKNDILILPTYTEAFPLVVLESLSVGIPVIATNTGAINELINGGCGRLIDSNFTEEEYINCFSESLISLPLEWDLSCSVNCINKYYSKYTKEEYVKRLMGIIQFDRSAA